MQFNEPFHQLKSVCWRAYQADVSFAIDCGGLYLSAPTEPAEDLIEDIREWSCILAQTLLEDEADCMTLH